MNILFQFLIDKVQRNKNLEDYPKEATRWFQFLIGKVQRKPLQLAGGNKRVSIPYR